jgi:hypothetical protein
MKKIFPFVVNSLILIQCALFFMTCTKEYSYEGGAQHSTAVYTLNAANGICTGSLVSGDYNISNPLNTTDTVQVEVDVITIGTYAIKTNSVDGFSFSLSGKFTETGIQTLTLAGSGTPAAAGSFDFKASGESVCSFTVEVKEALKAVFTMEGAPDSCTNAVVDTNYVVDTVLNNSNTVELNVTVTSIGEYKISTDIIDGMSFSKSGSFTETGNQKVILQGSGKPEISGTFTFSPNIDSSSCTFDIKVKPNPALYVLTSFGLAGVITCNHNIEGDYTAGKPLTDSNTCSIEIYIVKPGYVIISTAANNGIMFSYTGTFTTVGTKSTLMVGTGTPVNKGDYDYLPKIVGLAPYGGESCNFKLTVK